MYSNSDRTEYETREAESFIKRKAYDVDGNEMVKIYEFEAEDWDSAMKINNAMFDNHCFLLKEDCKAIIDDSGYAYRVLSVENGLVEINHSDTNKRNFKLHELFHDRGCECYAE